MAGAAGKVDRSGLRRLQARGWAVLAPSGEGCLESRECSVENAGEVEHGRGWDNREARSGDRNSEVLKA